MSGAYVHRPLGPSSASGQPSAQSNARLNDLLDFLKQECDGITSEAHAARLQNLEFENHAHGQVKEVTALRHTLTDLQRESELSKSEYEAEIHRLRREIEMLKSSASAGPSGSMPPAPPSSLSEPREARNHQQLQPLYNLLPPMQSSAGQNSPGPTGLAQYQSSAPARPPAQPHPHEGSAAGGPADSNGHSHSHHHHPHPHLHHHDHPLSSSSSGPGGPASAPLSAGGPWRRDDPDVRPDHAPKRLKMDEAASRPASGPPTPYEHPAHHSGPLNGSAGPPTLPPPANAPINSNVAPRPSPLPLSDRSSHPAAASTRPATETGTSLPHSNSHTHLPPLAAANNNSNAAKPAQSLQLQPVQSQLQPPPPPPQADWAILENPKVQHTLDIELWHTFTHDSVVCCVKFSPDAKYLAAGCNRNTYIYNAQTGQRECTLADSFTNPKEDNYIRSACFTPDGTKLATGSEDRKIRIWDLATRTVHQVLEGHKNEIYSLVFSPDGRLLYSGSGDSSVRIWDMETRTCKSTLIIDDQTIGENGQPIDAGVTSVALSPDGNILAAGSLDTHVRIWDAATGTRLDKLKGHKDSVYSVVFAPDASWLVSGSLDKTLKIWDLKPIYSILASNKEGTNSGAASEAGTGTGETSTVKSEEQQPSSALTQSTEGKTICTTTLCGHKDYVLSVAVPPSGKWIVSGSKDRGVSFWDPKVALANVVLQGHKNSVISIATSDVDNLLATGSGDWTCRIWKYKPAET